MAKTIAKSCGAVSDDGEDAHECDRPTGHPPPHKCWYEHEDGRDRYFLTEDEIAALPPDAEAEAWDG